MRICIIVLLLVASITVSAQKRFTEPFSKGKPRLLTAVNWGSWFYPEVGMSLFTGSATPFHPSAYNFSCEFNTLADNFMIAPKISYNITYLFFNLGAGGGYYTNFEKGRFYIRPHVGLSFLGYYSLLFGRNIAVAGNENIDSWVSNNQLSFVWLPFALRKDLKKLQKQEAGKNNKTL